MTDTEIMYRAIERWRDGDKEEAILFVRRSFGNTADKIDGKMTDDERALLLAIAKACYKTFSIGPTLCPLDHRPSGNEILTLIRKFDPGFGHDWQKALENYEARTKLPWYRLW